MSWRKWAVDAICALRRVKPSSCSCMRCSSFSAYLRSSRVRQYPLTERMSSASLTMQSAMRTSAAVRMGPRSPASLTCIMMKRSTHTSSACDTGRPQSSTPPALDVSLSTRCFLKSALNRCPPIRMTATKKRWMITDIRRGADCIALWEYSRPLVTHSAPQAISPRNMRSTATAVATSRQGRGTTRR